MSGEENYGPLRDPQQTGNGQPEGIVVYARRGYIILMFGLLGLIQGCLWNTWGPISDTAQLVYGWSNAQIADLALVGNLAYVVLAVPVCYVMDVYGLRKGVLLSAGLMFLGSGVRCIPASGTALFWTSVLCAAFSGIAAVVTFGGPPLVSSVWFPAHQRATATAVISLLNYAGVAMSFVIGVSVVPFEGTFHNLTSNTSTTEMPLTTSPDPEFGFMGALLLLLLIYFPAKPPTPPSVTAATGRIDYRQGLLDLIRKKELWFVALAACIPTGMLGVWPTVITIQFVNEGVSQMQAGWIGCCLSLAGPVAGIGVSGFSDKFSRHMKATLLAMYGLAAGALVWLVLLGEAYISFSLVSLYAAVILASIFVNGTVPLFYEISCELCFPQPEGVVGGFLTLLNNAMGAILLLVLQVPNIGTSWINWCLLGSVVVSLPLLLGVKESYGRLSIDEDDESDEPTAGTTNQKPDDVATTNTQNSYKQKS